MHPSIAIVLTLAVSYLIGAIPFAVVAMWGTGIDITKAGSRNPGFNNVWRVSNFRRSMVSLAGDLSKGGFAVFLLSSPADADWFRWALGLAAVAGHCWTPFLRFNGGKGVATMAGALLYLEPPITSCLSGALPHASMVRPPDGLGPGRRDLIDDDDVDDRHRHQRSARSRVRRLRIWRSCHRCDSSHSKHQANCFEVSLRAKNLLHDEVDRFGFD